MTGHREPSRTARFNGQGQLLEIFNHADRLALLQQLDAIGEPAAR